MKCQKPNIGVGWGVSSCKQVFVEGFGGYGIMVR